MWSRQYLQEQNQIAAQNMSPYVVYSIPRLLLRHFQESVSSRWTILERLWTRAQLSVRLTKILPII